MEEKLDKKYYYDIHNAYTYACLFNFLMGARGKGKTYSAKMKGITNALRGKGEFIYLRRYKEELKKLKKDNKFFEDIVKNNEFPDTELTVKGDLLFADKKKIGYLLPLSTAITQKSVPYNDVTLLIFDEFVIPKDSDYRYLGDEVFAFMEFFMSVFRDRDNITVLFLSNGLTVSNPYFIYFNINIDRHKRFNHFKERDMLVEMCPDNGFIEQMNKTRIGKIIHGTRYGAYAIENDFYYDNKEFIEKKKGTAHYYCTLKYKEVLFGVWIDYTVGKFYISNDIDTSYSNTFCLTLADHSPNTILINRRNQVLKLLAENFKIGKVSFESIKLKNQSLNALKLLI